MKNQTSPRKTPGPGKQLKRQLRRRLKPVVESSRVLKFGIKGLTFVRGSLERAEHLRRWVTASALRISNRGSRS